MVIREVAGRKSGGERGLAPLHSVVAEGADGKEFAFGRVSRGEQVPVQQLHHAGKLIFDRCPICLDPEPVSKEHVPPSKVGGSWLTNTCIDCNNDLGSLVDSDLIDWYDDALTPVTMSHADVPGARKTSRLLYRETPDGSFVLVPEGYFDPAISSKFAPGEDFELSYAPPDTRRVRLAVLKNTYLGACLIKGEIITSPEAEQVRAELMALRGLKRADPLPDLGPAARSIKFSKSNGPAVAGQVSLVMMQSIDGADPWFGVSLAGTVLGSWVFGSEGLFVTSEGQHQRVAMGGIDQA